MLKFKSFSSKEGKFSLELNCRECGDKFVGQFTIGSCPDCSREFDGKVNAKLENWREEGKEIGWEHKILAMVEVLDPNKLLEKMRKES